MQGGEINQRHDGVTVDGAKVVQADIVADNGVIHVIDAVILPKCNACRAGPPPFGRPNAGRAPHPPLGSTAVCFVQSSLESRDDMGCASRGGCPANSRGARTA